MKRIAMISSHGHSLVNFRGPLIKALVNQGLEVYAFAPDFTDGTESAVKSMGAVPIRYTLARTGMDPIADLGDLLGLVKILRRLKVDTTFAYTIKPVIYGTIAAALAGVPHRFALISGLGYVFTPSATKEPFRRKLLRSIVTWMYKTALRFAKKVFFQNGDDLELFVNWGVVPKDKAMLIRGSGVDLDEWKPAPVVKSPVTFLLAARLLREKGILEYIGACRTIKKRHPDVRCILLGEPDSNPGALSKEVAEGWVQEGVVEWPGHVPIKPWLSQASVYVLPSYREGVPRSSQEAMAMGRALITTDAPGCRETVIDGENGYLVPVGDSKDLARAMEKFVLDRELIQKMGSASRSLAEARFDVRAINRSILSELGIR